MSGRYPVLKRGIRLSDIEITHVIFVGVVPVYDMEPVVYVICPHIVVFQVIGMLPDVDIEDGAKAERQRCILIPGCYDIELPEGVYHKPCIAGTEYG